jgi:hypothetical protein
VFADASMDIAQAQIQRIIANAKEKNGEKKRFFGGRLDAIN